MRLVAPPPKHLPDGLTWNTERPCPRDDPQPPERLPR